MASENSITEAIRNNPGGLGEHLTDKQKQDILCGPRNEPENTDHFDGDKFSEGLQTAMKNHPVEWLL